MALFRKGPSPHQTALAMIGARAGTRVLVAGTPAPGVVAELAAVTGLNGQTLLVVRTDARAPYDAAAAEAGALVETLEAPDDSAIVPATSGDYDAVVLHYDLATLDEDTRRRLIASAFAAVRPSGRVVVIEGRPPAGWLGRRTPTQPGPAVLALLEGAGGLAARELGTVDGVGYFEARKGR